MRRQKSIKHRILKLLMPFILVFFGTYSLYQLFSGERGLFTWLDLRDQVLTLRQENAALKEQKALLEDKTSRLQVNRIDEDFLDEQIRRKLPYLQPGEHVIFLPTTPEKSHP